jgi:hypothetical protein
MWQWALVGVIGVLSLFGFAAYIGLVGNPAINQARGTVLSVERLDDEIELCLSEPVDAGSTYGDRRYSDVECWQGLIETRLPEPGECVVVRAQGHVSELEVKKAAGCQ